MGKIGRDDHGVCALLGGVYRHLGLPVRGSLELVGEVGFMAERNWYLLHTYSGAEEKARNNLEQKIKTLALSDRVFSVVLPVDNKVIIKNGERKVKQEKVYPGYLVVEMIMDDETWNVVRTLLAFSDSSATTESPFPFPTKRSSGSSRTESPRRKQSPSCISRLATQCRSLAAHSMACRGRLRASRPRRRKRASN